MVDDRPESTVLPTPRRSSADYTGAVYGSLLAASVVAGTSPRVDAAEPWALAALLLATGVVFWLAHAFARLVGYRVGHAVVTWEEVRTVAAHERPILLASVPPAAAAVIANALGASDLTVAWIALIVAVAGQVSWAVCAALNVGATRRLVVIAGLGNLLLGLVIIALKVAIAH